MSVELIIVISLLAFLVILIPVLEYTRLKNVVSYRWIVMSVVLCLTVACVIDFNTLPEDIKRIVVLGGILISGGFIAVRTLEKCWGKGYRFAIPKMEASKGDLNVKIDGGPIMVDIDGNDEEEKETQSEEKKETEEVEEH